MILPLKSLLFIIVLQGNLYLDGNEQILKHMGDADGHLENTFGECSIEIDDTVIDTIIVFGLCDTLQLHT